MGIRDGRLKIVNDLDSHEEVGYSFFRFFFLFSGFIEDFSQVMQKVVGPQCY